MKLLKHEVVFIVIIVFIIIISIAANIVNANTFGLNYKNVTVTTRVNITNAMPQVLSVQVFQETNFSAVNITLNGGMTRTVTCNASIREWNGFNDISRVNATLYDNQSANPLSADNNNTHYTNLSCQQIVTSGYYANYTCTFQVYYYANNTNWLCNVSVNDSKNKVAYNFNKTLMNALYALNVTDGLDYGNMDVETYSANITANITNFGNKLINVTVFGYGTRYNDGLAMNCSLNGNITIDNERYATNDTTDFSLKTQLTSSAVMIPGLTMLKQTNPATQIINATYWQLYASSANNPAGNCSGYVVFSAEAP